MHALSVTDADPGTGMKYINQFIIAGLLAAGSAAQAEAQVVVPLEILEPLQTETPEYLVATGRMRKQSEAVEYCLKMGRRLPTREEAEKIYHSTVDPVNGTSSLASLKPVDTLQQDGSFWTSATQGVLACPVALRVNPLKSKEAFRFESYCRAKTRFLTICVGY